MWFIFIAVLIVVAVMLVFLLMAIRLLASQAKQSLDGYFMKNLEVYEELEENLSLRTKELQGQIDGQEKKLDILSEETGTDGRDDQCRQRPQGDGRR